MGGDFFVKDVGAAVVFGTDWATELTTFDCFVRIVVVVFVVVVVGGGGGIHGAIVLSEHIGGQGGSHGRHTITISRLFFLPIVVVVS